MRKSGFKANVRMSAEPGSSIILEILGLICCLTLLSFARALETKKNWDTFRYIRGQFSLIFLSFFFSSLIHM